MKKELTIQFMQYGLIVAILRFDEIKQCKVQDGFLSLGKGGRYIGLLTPMIYKNKMKCISHSDFENCYSITLD